MATPNDAAEQAKKAQDDAEKALSGAEKQDEKPAEKADEGMVTMSQAKLDALIEERIARERRKNADQITDAEKALEQVAELREQLAAAETDKVRASISAETGVPAALLTGDTEETMRATATAITEYAGAAKPAAGPVVKSVGGEQDAVEDTHGWSDSALSIVTGD